MATSLESLKENESGNKTSALDDVFAERDKPKIKQETPKKETENTDKEPKISDKKTDTEKESEKNTNQKASLEDDEESELENIKKELEKTKIALTENQKWGRANSQKLKNAFKHVKNFIDEGIFTEDEAKPFLQLLENEPSEQQENDTSVQLTPGQKILKIANQELENIKKYTDDELLDKKVSAFDFFLNTAPETEIKDALDELFELQDNPVKLTKKMLSIGQQYYQEVLKEVEETGGFKNFVANKNSELEKLQKKIDKLQKKLAQYDYDQPTFKIDELSDSDKFEKVKPKSVFDEAVEERDTVRRR